MTSSLADLLDGLPPEPSEADLFANLQRSVQQGPRPLVAIDDDPTGVQTVHDTSVLLTWGKPELQAELTRNAPVFFVLTNSRSMPTEEAERVNVTVGQNLSAARAAAGSGPFVVASRSDSTLRGHFPAEPLALQAGLGERFDGHLLVPAFFEGGRYTIDDTHWVATPTASSPEVVPASATSFAQDAVFRYHTAYLPAWVEEKSRGRWAASEVLSVPLPVVRQGPDAVCARLLQVDGGVPVVVNAAGYGDLSAFVLGLLQAEVRGKRFLYRTAASFVRIRAGMSARPLLSGVEVATACGEDDVSAQRGLVVVGSYQPSTTEQVQRLLATPELRPRGIEVDVAAVLSGGWSPEQCGAMLNAALEAGDLPVLYTSRQLVVGVGDENLGIGQKVIDGLLAALRHLEVRPRFIVAKGGITSHVVAERGLGALRAQVLGQVLAGVPVWRLETGPESRFPGMPYVVFPGNVGDPEGLVDAVRLLGST
ncbi:MAG: four-carbon acid sugar kinase family protein [Chloroflexota bacterium]